jgi:hypothetical protein
LKHHGICQETAAQVLVEDPEQPRLDLQPSDTLAHLNAVSIRYRFAVGQGAGGKTLALKNPYRDGTTHILFSPADFIARVAALVPRPRINLAGTPSSATTASST